MRFEIKNRFSGEVIFTAKTESLKLAVELAVEAKSNLYGANLSEADLSGANLSGANLSGADLYGASLYRANLSGADLSGASLYRADLSGANLSGAYLSGADLYRADLYGAKIKFSKFPTIRLLSSISLGSLSSSLSLELMRRDAYAHPYPERFDDWAKGGRCPYQKEERFWSFDLRKKDWKPGNPEMTDVELILAICAEKGWEIEA